MVVCQLVVKLVVVFDKCLVCMEQIENLPRILLTLLQDHVCEAYGMFNFADLFV